MSKTRIIIEQVQEPERLTRDERRVRQHDDLKDKMEYASDLVHANFKREPALACIRKCWSWLESIDNLPDHLKEIKDYIRPIIREYGEEDVSKPKKESEDAKDSDME